MLISTHPTVHALRTALLKAGLEVGEVVEHPKGSGFNGHEYSFGLFHRHGEETCVNVAKREFHKLDLKDPRVSKAGRQPVRADAAFVETKRLESQGVRVPDLMRHVARVYFSLENASKKK